MNKKIIYDPAIEEVKADPESVKKKEEIALQALDGKKEVVDKPITFIPGPNRILVEVFKEEYDGKLIRPEAFAKWGNKGRIIKLGKETPDKPQIWKEGMTVYYPKNATVIDVVDGDRKVVCINQFDAYGYEE